MVLYQHRSTSTLQIHITHRVEVIEKIQFVSEPRLRHMRKTYQVSHPF